LSKFVKLNNPANLDESIDESYYEKIDLTKLPFVNTSHP
jgi:hypothetical protein